VSSRFDVAILGGGPAGLSAAIALCRRGRSVLVVDRERAEGPRVGETLAPDVRHLLESLRVGDGFDLVPSIGFVGTKSVWGTAEPFERSAILNPLGAGLHVDRAAFDAWLRVRAAEAGTSFHTAGSYEILSNADGWRLKLGDDEVRARYLLDARGRPAPGSQLVRRWVAFDRLVGVVGWMRPSDNAQPEPELLIEAIEQGWWYSAPQPGGGLVATLMTDADLIDASGREGLLAFWRRTLEKAPLTRDRLTRFSFDKDLEVRRAESGYAYPDRGPRWQAVGDAAVARDPLAGVGIAQAIRSGVEAAANVDRILAGEPCLEKASDPPLAYLEEKARYYVMEQRWPSSLFWARRHPVDLSNFQPFIHPEAILVSGPVDIAPSDSATIESLLPPRAVRDLLSHLKTPQPAHEALMHLRTLTGPLGDQRLLAGLQLLVMAGFVEIVPTRSN
jgi:flavin-dependent dehydrogenase